MKKLPDASFVKTLFHYDRETGIFTRTVSRSKARAGEIQNRKNADGYVVITINKSSYMAARLAYEYVNGGGSAYGWQVDHINGDRADNRIANLRLASHADNRNNSSVTNAATGLRGIHWERKGRRYGDKLRVAAVIYRNGKRVWRRYFKDIESAARARDDVIKTYHGDFSSLSGVSGVHDSKEHQLS